MQEWRLYCLNTGNVIKRGNLSKYTSMDNPVCEQAVIAAGVEHWGKHFPSYSGEMVYWFTYDQQLSDHFGWHTVVMYSNGEGSIDNGILESIITKHKSIPEQALVVIAGFGTQQ